MLTSTNIAQINRALENSFASIKKDINELRLTISSQAENNSSLRKDLEAAKINAVTTDKLNVLKIKIGELNEELKKIWEIEKQIKSVGGSKALQEAMDELNAKLIALNIKTNDISKNSVTESQMKTLVSQINSEINKLNQDLRNAELRRDEFRRKDILEHTQKISSRVDQTDNNISDLRKELRNYVDKNEVKKILDEINNDFVDVKKEISNVYKRDSAFVRESEVKDILKSINKEFDGIAGEIESLKKKDVDFVTVKQVKDLITDISDEFDDLRNDLRKIADSKDISTKKDIEALKKTYSGLQKEIKKPVKIPDTYGASVVFDAPPKKVKPDVPHRKKFIFASVMIFVAFALLIGSIYSYFTGYMSSMDNLAISAVAAFILGMLVRAYAVIKSSKV